MKKCVVILLLISVSLCFVACGRGSDDTYYTISFRGMGGNPDVSEILVKGNESITFPTRPTREGYAFDGWYYDVTHQTVFTENSLTASPLSSDLSVYASWKSLNDDDIKEDKPDIPTPTDPVVPTPVDPDVVVSFDSGSGMKVADTGALVESEPITKRGGYVFLGWYTDEDYSSDRITFPHTFTENVTLYAKWSDDMTFTRKTESSEIITFGSYPQSLVTDETTINELKNITPIDGIFVHNGERYVKLSAKPAIDAKFTNGAPIIYGMEYYFRYDPIRWIYISEQMGDANILSEKILDASRYGDGSVGYAESALHALLYSSPLSLSDTASNAMVKKSYDEGVVASLIAPTSKEFSQFPSQIKTAICTDYALARGAKESDGTCDFWLRNQTGNFASSASSGMVGTRQKTETLGVRPMATVRYYYKVTFGEKTVLADWHQQITDFPIPSIETGEGFFGWYADEALTQPVGSVLTVTSDMVLYPKIMQVSA